MTNMATWEQAVRENFAIPDGTLLSEAAAELTVLLGSPDQHQRDDVAYELLSTWIARGTFDDLLVGLGDGLCAGLRQGLGETGTDSVFRRSYSALVLASIVERDSAIRVVHPSHVLRWADAGLYWFVAERDLRGHAGWKGRVQAVAHGADLIAALARSRHLGPEELGVLLDAIADRLSRSTSFLTHAEDDRLAYATMAVLHRDLLDDGQLEAWLARLIKPLELDIAGPHAAAHVNTQHYVRALHLMLRFGVVGAAPWHRGQLDPFDVEPAGRIALLRAVEGVLRGYHPGLYRPPSPNPDPPAAGTEPTGRG
jgi:hypothetical protein